ncbi:MAG: GMC family oxidoreductase, partial [Alphaproteobacteria bacterium]
LTAGSFQSPKLLKLSGIGPREELDRHGIDVIHDAALVGENYQDHVGAPLTARLKHAIGLHGADKGMKALGHGLRYMFGGGGLLSTNLLQGGACVDTDGSGRPDVQYNLAPFAPGGPGQPPLDFHALQIHPMTMRPLSRGRLGLRSKDPKDSLYFEAEALGRAEDLDTLRRGVRLAREILQQSGLTELIQEEVWPGAGVSTKAGSNNLDDAIRAQARTIFHPAGTCQMGGAETSVVDPELRVRGVEGLRVADCSVMPALVSGNTNAPTMMIADRCADFILSALD